MRFLLPILSLPLLLVSCRPAELAPVAVAPPPLKLPVSVQKLKPEQVLAIRQSTPDLIIIDLRENGEIKLDGRLAGTTHFVDYLNTTAFNELVAKLDPTKPCLLCCALGGRAQHAAADMSAKGFKNLMILDGGFDAWLRAGQATEK
jgi:rhodanese-related sulfurtransferase